MDIYFEQGVSSAITGADNNCLIIGKVSSFSGSNNLVEATSLSELESNGIAESNGGVLYRAAKSFFAANGLMPKPAKLYAYAVDGTAATSTIEKEEMLGVVNGSNATFKTQGSPVSDQAVYIQWEDGGDYITQPTVSYSPETIATDIYSGEIEFSEDDDALTILASGAVAGAPPTYAKVSDLGVTYPSAKIFSDYTQSGLGGILKTLREVDVHAWMFAYDETPTLMATGYYTGTGGSWTLDQIVGANESLIASQKGKSRIFVRALPTGVEPDDEVASNLRTGISSYDWREIGNVSGNKLVTSVAHDVLTASGVPVNNMSATMMGTIAGQYPLNRNFALRGLSISQTTFPLESVIDKWTTAQVNVIIEMPDLYPTERLLSFGMTHGSGIEKHVEYIRCATKFARELNAGMHDLIRNRTVRISKQGALALNAAIMAIANRLKTEEVLDGLAKFNEDGYHPIENPYLDLITKSSKSAADLAELAAYNVAKTFPPVTVNWKWSGNLEHMTIRMRVVLT